MPHPFLIVSQSHYLIQVDDKNSPTKWHSANPDQLASEEANWSGSTLFAKAGHTRVQGLTFASKFCVKIFAYFSESLHFKENGYAVKEATLLELFYLSSS